MTSSSSEVVYGRKCLVHDLALAVEGLLNHTEPSDVVTDDDVHLQLFCATTEAVFLYGFQGIAEGFFGTPCGYDRFIRELPEYYPDASGAVAAVWAISKIKTPNGRGRAFVKFALIEKKLDLYMLALTHNRETVRQYYMDGALLLSSPDLAEMMKLLVALRVVNFSLFLKESDTSLETERNNFKHVGLRTGKLVKTEADMIISECSWCLFRTTHALVSEDVQQLYRCQTCQKLTMICYNHCGGMARCLPQRRLQEATCAICAGDIHGWKATPAADEKVASKAGGSKPSKKSKAVKTKTVDLDALSPTITTFGSSPTMTSKPPLALNARVVATATIGPDSNQTKSRTSSRTPSVSDLTHTAAEPSAPALPTPASSSPVPESPPPQTNIASVDKLDSPATTQPTIPSDSVFVEPAPGKASAPTTPLALDTRVIWTDAGKGAKDHVLPTSHSSSPTQQPSSLSKSGIPARASIAATPDDDAEPSPVVSAQPPTKIFEGMFQVSDSDDQQTAELKRKLLERIKSKNDLSSECDTKPAPFTDTDVGMSKFTSSPVRQPPSPVLSSFLRPRTPESPSKDRFKMAAEQEADYAALQATPTKPSDIIVTRSHWMPDDQTDVCSIVGCGATFTFFNRRHHCRRCGDIVCDKHSRKTLKLNAHAVPDPDGVESRVCDECYDSYSNKLSSSEEPPNSTTPAPANLVQSASLGDTRPSQRTDSQTSFSAPAFDQVPFNIPVKPKKIPDFCGVCGTTLSKRFMAAPWYCEAMGLYCCNACHSGEKIIVPAQVLRNWNFTPMEVCDRMRAFLSSLHEQPMYNIDAINPALYQSVSKLRTMKGIREQMGHLQSFLLTCTASKSEKIDKLMPLVTAFDPQRYSMRELIDLNEGTLPDYISSINRDLMAHVFECDLCKAKGFICEICRDPKPFYSFQTQISEQCPACKAFFHSECRKLQVTCPRCTRRSKGASI